MSIKISKHVTVLSIVYANIFFTMETDTIGFTVIYVN